MIEIFCDSILPGDKDLGMPSATAVNMPKTLRESSAGAQLEDYFRLLDELSGEKFNEVFASLALDSRLQIVEQSKRKNNRLANMVILECLKIYYTDAEVLKRLPAGAVPPFPEGNSMEEDDWSLLEPVYERGRMYRLTET